MICVTILGHKAGNQAIAPVSELMTVSTYMPTRSLTSRLIYHFWGKHKRGPMSSCLFERLSEILLDVAVDEPKDTYG